MDRAEIVSILKCILRLSYLPQCPLNFEGICYIIYSDYSEPFLFCFCLIVAYAALSPVQFSLVQSVLNYLMVWKLSERKTEYFVFRVLFFIPALLFYIIIYLFIFNANNSTRMKTERNQLLISRQKLSLYLVCLFRASTSTHYNNDYIAIITECKSFLFKKRKEVLSVCGFNLLSQRVHVL